MGYRSQSNYDEAEREAWRNLPWWHRYDWRLVAIIAVVVARNPHARNWPHQEHVP
jgi:hypothetical protein